MKRRQLLSGCGAILGALSVPGLASAGTSRGCGPSELPEMAGELPPPPAMCGPARRRFALRSALGWGFGIQYWGDSFSTRGLRDAPHGVLIVEPTRVGAFDNSLAHEVLFDAEEIGEIRAGGRKLVIGYLNLTEIETYREYWRNHVARAAAPEGVYAASWIGPETAQGERLARFWSPVWEGILVRRIERLMALGLDGIFLDDVLHYFSFVSGEGLDWGGGGPPEERSYATAMAGLVTRLAACARNTREDAVVIVNNGVFLPGDTAAEIGPEAAAPVTEAYLESIDGILVESAFGQGASQASYDALRRLYLPHGISVLTVDFVPQFPELTPGAVRWIVEALAADMGFVPYVADDHAFDRLYPPSGEWFVTARYP